MTDQDDIIDLRKYFQILFQHWRRLAIVTGIFTAVALTVLLTSERRYESTVTILVTRSRVALTLANQFPTLNEPIDSVSRMNAINAIIQSDSIFNKTFQSVRDELPSRDEDLFSFRQRLSLNTVGDAIQITASAESPELAARIANSWAVLATEEVNTAYSENQPLTEVREQLISARSDYETAQSSLESFIQENQIELLTRQIAEAQVLLDNLTGTRAWQIQYYAERARAMEQLIVEAAGLRQQFEQGNATQAGRLGDAIALFNARVFSLGINLSPQVAIPQDPEQPAQRGQPFSFNLQLPDVAGFLETTENFAADLDRLIEIAQDERATALAELDNLTGEVFDSQGAASYLELTGRIQDLESQLENETARELTLTSDRDLTWQAYQAIAEKEVEIRNSVNTETLVSIASDAIPPARPVSRGTILFTLISAVIGFLLSAFITLLIEWWRSS